MRRTTLILWVSLILASQFILHTYSEQEVETVEIDKNYNNTTEKIVRVHHKSSATTGFKYEEKYVVTAEHLGNFKPGDKVVINSVFMNNTITGVVKGEFDLHDTLVIKSQESFEKYYTKEDLTKKTTEKVHIYGYSSNIPKSKTRDFLKYSQEPVTINDSVEAIEPILKYSGKTEKGYSGSPVLNESGYVLGMAIATSENKSYATTLDRLKRNTIERNGTKVLTPPITCFTTPQERKCVDD